MSKNEKAQAIKIIELWERVMNMQIREARKKKQVFYIPMELFQLN